MGGKPVKTAQSVEEHRITEKNVKTNTIPVNTPPPEQLSPVPAASRHSTLHIPELLSYGGLLALLYVLIVALSPLPVLHLSSTPLPKALPWTLLPSKLLFPSAWTAVGSSSPARDWPYIALFAATLIALTVIYAHTLHRAMQRPHSQSSSSNTRWLLILLGGVLVFGLILLFQPTLLSDDVFTYIFSGRILTIYHADPLNALPQQFPHDPYLQWVVSGRATSNVYGPLWLWIASLLVSIGKGAVATLLLFKGIALLSHLLNCLFIWAILGKIAPSRRVLGTLLYAWNPLAILELVASGHNEGILLGLLLLAILLYVQGKGRWYECGVLLLLGIAVSMNLITILIAPLLLWFIVREEPNVLHAFWGFCWRASIVLALAIAIYIPFWHSSTTFFAITSAVDMAHFIHSPMGILVRPSHWFFGLVAQWSNFPPVMQPTIAADATIRVTTIFFFVLIYVHLFGKVRHATTTVAGMRYAPATDQAMQLPGFDTLLDCWSSAIFWYLILILGVFWPWYVLWALWIVALRQLDWRSITLLLLSSTALLIYPLLNLDQSPFIQYQSLLIFGPPLVFLFVKRKP